MNADTQQVFECAESLYRKGDFRGSQPLFERIVKQNPDGYPDVYNRLGVIHHAKGRVSDAVDCFEKAVGFNPGYTEASLNLVVAYNDLGRFEDAEEVFHQASDHLSEGEEQVARNAIANRHLSLGDDYVRIGRLEDGLHEYRRALTLCPLWVDVICKVGETLRKLDRLDDALRVFGRAKELNGKFAEPFVQMGHIYYKKGFLDMALSEWQTALELDPSRRDAEAYLATVRRALLQE